MKKTYISWATGMVYGLETSMNVLLIRDCSMYMEPMTSHSLGGIAGSQQMDFMDATNNNLSKFHPGPI